MDTIGRPLTVCTMRYDIGDQLVTQRRVPDLFFIRQFDPRTMTMKHEILMGLLKLILIFIRVLQNLIEYTKALQ